MQKTIAWTALVTLAVFAQSCSAQSDTKQPLQIASKNRLSVDWQSDVQLAMQRATQENKMVFIDIGADW